MLVGLGHRSGTGKDTLAGILVREHGFVRLAFADALKDFMTAIAPYLDREVSDAIADLGLEEAKRSVTSVREAMDHMGSAIHARLGSQVLIQAVMRRIDRERVGRFVVSDVRTEAEVRAVRTRGGMLVRVDRPDAAVVHNRYEDALSGFAQWDRVVVNDGRMSDLEVQAADLVGSLCRSRAA